MLSNTQLKGQAGHWGTTAPSHYDDTEAEYVFDILTIKDASNRGERQRGR